MQQSTNALTKIENRDQNVMLNQQNYPKKVLLVLFATNIFMIRGLFSIEIYCS